MLNSYLTNNPKPQTKIPTKKLVTVDITQGKTVTLNRAQNYDKSRNTIIPDVNGAEEYSWYGWSRYEGYKDYWNLIGRLTWEDVGVGNADWWADRTLSVWAGPDFIHFTTYTFDRYGNDDYNRVRNIYVNIYDWFFIYHGYSYTE